jgi:hypothetical protein
MNTLVEVSGLDVLVYARQVSVHVGPVYRIEPGGESWTPGDAVGGGTWYEVGRQAVIDAARDDVGRFSTAHLAVLSRAAATITGLYCQRPGPATPDPRDGRAARCVLHQDHKTTRHFDGTRWYLDDGTIVSDPEPED